MGVDIHNVRQIAHIGPPHTIREYLFSTCPTRAGRDGESSKAILYYNNRDIAKKKPGIQEEIKMFCRSKGVCLRKLLLQYLDVEQPVPVTPSYTCCSVCKDTCICTVVIFRTLELGEKTVTCLLKHIVMLSNVILIPLSPF